MDNKYIYISFVNEVTVAKIADAAHVHERCDKILNRILYLKVVKKRTFTATKMAITQSIFTLHTCYTITESEILSDFQIIL